MSGATAAGSCGAAGVRRVLAHQDVRVGRRRPSDVAHLHRSCDEALQPDTQDSVDLKPPCCAPARLCGVLAAREERPQSSELRRTGSRPLLRFSASFASSSAHGCRGTQWAMSRPARSTDTPCLQRAGVTFSKGVQAIVAGVRACAAQSGRGRGLRRLPHRRPMAAIMSCTQPPWVTEVSKWRTTALVGGGEAFRAMCRPMRA